MRIEGKMVGSRKEQERKEQERKDQERRINESRMENRTGMITQASKHHSPPKLTINFK
jgi:hypothetical protein